MSKSNVKYKVIYRFTVEKEIDYENILRYIPTQVPDVKSCKVLEKPSIKSKIEVEAFVETDDFLWKVEVKGDAIQNMLIKEGYNILENEVEIKMPLSKIGKIKN